MDYSLVAPYLPSLSPSSIYHSYRISETAEVYASSAVSDIFHFYRERRTNHAEKAAERDPQDHCGSDRSGASLDLCGGVTDTRHAFLEKVLGALLAAAVAAICAAIDYLLDKENAS